MRHKKAPAKSCKISACGAFGNKWWLRYLIFQVSDQRHKGTHKHTAKTRGDASAAISPRVLPKTAAVKVSARIREGDREREHHWGNRALQRASARAV
jgi:hypothetical protein